MFPTMRFPEANAMLKVKAKEMHFEDIDDLTLPYQWGPWD